MTRLRAIGIWVLGLGISSASAQTAPPAGTTPAFVVQSDDGDNRLQLGGMAQVDGRFSVDDAEPTVPGTFLVRRLRAITQGRVARHFDFYVNVDFAGSTVNVRDVYVDTHVSDALRIRVGRFKTPFSYDRLILAANLLFVERGFTASVAPDRDTGVQVLGDLAANRVSYATSVTNGVIDGGSGDVDGNTGKDLTGRLVVRPWAAIASSRLQGLGLAIAGSVGSQSGALPSFSSPGRQVFFAYSDAWAEGRRTRWSPQAFYYRGPLGAYAEYVRSRGGVRTAAAVRDVDHEAWQAVGSWVITGEAAGERNVRPDVSFDPASDHWGAVQVTARYHVLRVSKEARMAGLAAPAASLRADAWTFGINWYLNPFIKWNLDIERTVFDGGRQSRPAENAILLRAHLGF